VLHFILPVFVTDSFQWVPVVKSEGIKWPGSLISI